MKELLFTTIPKRILAITLGGVIVLFVCMLGLLHELNEYTNTAVIEQTRFESMRHIFKNTNIEASSAIVYDATNNKIVYAKFPTVRKPLASVSKIMTALVARSILSSEEPITITDRDITSEPDYALRRGDIWTARDLTQYFLIKSSNDGAQAVCNAVTRVVSKQNPSVNCISLMNEYAKNQGLSSLYFANPSGLDLPSGAPSNFGTAYDVARMLARAYETQPSLFSVTSKPTASFKTARYIYEAENTDKILEEIGTVRAGKTGFTYTAGGNLAVLYEPRPNVHLVIVVLGSSRDGRFSDMLELVRRGNYYANTLAF